MFAHILVPLDLGRRHDRVLATALALALQGRARVTLVHVIHRIEHVPVAELRRFYDRLGKVAQRVLGQAARRFIRKGIPLRALVLTGDPPHEIVRWAASNRVDLIVLGSHRVNLSRPAERLGTTSYKVGILCQCPVLLVK